MADLPIGFRQLSLGGHFSLRMINLLRNVANLTTHIFADKSAGPSAETARTLQTTTNELYAIAEAPTTSIEKYTCFALTAYLPLLRRQPALTFAHCASLGPVVDQVFEFKMPPQEDDEDLALDLMTWSYAVITCAVDSAVISFKNASLIHDRVLFRYPSINDDWPALEKVLRQFLWSGELVMKWRKAWEAGLRALH